MARAGLLGQTELVIPAAACYIRGERSHDSPKEVIGMKQVLVVDDVPEVRMVLRALLEGPDVGVLEAEDGLKAIEVLTADKVDLVITDCQMPRMSGLELMRQRRKLRVLVH